MPDNRFLLKRYQGYYAVVEVPPSLQGVLGRRIVKTLKTRDLHVARARRHRVVAEMKERIEAARKAQQGPKGDPLIAEALEWRSNLMAAQEGAEEFIGPTWETPDGELISESPEGFLRGVIGDRAEALHDSRDPAQAVRWREFLDLATGVTTPISAYLNDWLAEGTRGVPIGSRTADQRRSALEDLAQWMAAQRLPVTLEAVNRRVAGQYTQSLLRGDRTPQTVSLRVRAIAQFWSWLQLRGHLPEDMRSPWTGQAPRKRKRDPGGITEERAFTGQEVVLLVDRAPTQVLREFMLVAALTGMRREEIGLLRVKDCQGGVMIIRQGKTAAAARRVPVHSMLAEIIDRRTRGQPPDAFLFADLPGSQEERRTDAIGKAFMRHRRALGIQDGTGRRALVNFHSFRRFFVTEAVNATKLPHMVSLVVGHTEGRQGMTLNLYWQGANDDALRAVVESVKLPLH